MPAEQEPSMTDETNQSPAPDEPGPAWECDAELFAELAGLLIATAPVQLAALRDAARCADPPRLSSEAHSLKGALANFGAAAAAVAGEVEHLAAAGALSEAADRLPRLDAEVGRLLASLAAAVTANGLVHSTT